MPQMTEGRCHCGAVRVRVERPPAAVTECRCSICLRYGALWAYYPRAEVTMTGPTVVYTWGRRYVDFHHCGVCGCVMGWTPRSPAYGEQAVNARMLEGFDPDGVQRFVEADASV